MSGESNAAPQPRVQLAIATALALSVVLAGSLLAVDLLGKGLRRQGVARRLGDPELPVLLVENGAQVLDAWVARGIRGRLVLYASSHLHFIDPEEPFAKLELAGFPFSLPAVYRSFASDESFLWAATRTGLAREVVHLLPRDVFEQKLAALQLDARRIVVREMGLRRTVLHEVPLASESVVLGIDASLFDSARVNDVLEALFASELTTDLLVLNLALDSTEVSDAARRGLRDWHRALWPAETAR